MKSLLPEELQRYFELARSMGRLASQFITGRPEEIRFTMVGKRFEEDFGERTFDSPFNYQPFTIAALKGFLEVVLEDSVSFINIIFTKQCCNFTNNARTVIISKIDIIAACF